MGASAATLPVSKTKRKDPTPRHTTGLAQNASGVSRFTQIVNARPDRKYMLVYKAGDETSGLPYYESIGYEIVLATDGGERLLGIKTKPNEPIEFRGSVLMSVSLERAEEIVQHGPDGGAGQLHVDSIEQRIIRGRGTHDPFRGIHGITGRSGNPVAYRAPEQATTDFGSEED